MISTSELPSTLNGYNPITSIRTSVDLSIREFARVISISPQTLYLTECGCYTRIPPKIIHRLIEEDYLGTDRQETVLLDTIPVGVVHSAYTFFRECKQRQFGLEYRLNTLFDWDGLSSPVESFYTSLGLSRSGFAKSLAIQPSSLVRLNNKALNQIPGQILKALTTAGLSNNLLTELQDRHESYVRL